MWQYTHQLLACSHTNLAKDYLVYYNICNILQNKQLDIAAERKEQGRGILDTSSFLIVGMKSLSFNRDLYSKAALLKAAYHFTDQFYVYLDQDSVNYHVEITAKDGVEEDSIEAEFANEILAQATREEILHQTAHIRELVLGRAFGSTIVENIPEEEETPSVESDDNLFKDWYQA